MAKVDMEPGPNVIVDVDKWAGYEHERRWLLRHLRDQNISVPVVLTGDIHSNSANELWDDFDSSIPHPVAVELVGTSISSGGNGVGQPEEHADLLAQNPAVKFHNEERGYVSCADSERDVWRERPAPKRDSLAPFDQPRRRVGPTA